MGGLIKNIPVMGFGVHGNRGLGFPQRGHLVEGFVDDNLLCSLEQDQSQINILAENGLEISIICSDVVNEVRQPNIKCVLGSQEDVDLEILLQEGLPIIVNCE